MFISRSQSKERPCLLYTSITADTLEELEEILILADVGVTTAGKICSRLGERSKHKSRCV